MIVKRRVTLAFLLTVTLISLYFSFILFRPFIYPIVTATVIAIIFYPAHQQVQRVIKSQSLSALVSTLLVILVVIGPMTVIVAAIIGEVQNLVELIQKESNESGGLLPYLNELIEQPLRWLRKYINVPQINLRNMVQGRLEALGEFLAAEAGALLGGIASTIVNIAITIFTLFFLFREGKSARRRLAAVMPLSNEQIDKLFTGIENTIIGTVYGGLVVAGVQGAMIGVALWLFGIPSPVLWAVVAGFFALIPLVGTAAVWVPSALYLLASGHYAQAIILAVWGGGVVGSMDNFLRPYLISGRVQMHTLLIFFAVFGGVSAFGFLGLFIGPVILAITTTLLSLLRDEAKQWQSLWREEEPEQVEPALEGGKVSGDNVERSE